MKNISYSKSGRKVVTQMSSKWACLVSTISIAPNKRAAQSKLKLSRLIHVVEHSHKGIRFIPRTLLHSLYIHTHINYVRNFAKIRTKFVQKDRDRESQLLGSATLVAEQRNNSINHIFPNCEIIKFYNYKQTTLKFSLIKVLNFK